MAAGVRYTPQARSPPLEAPVPDWSRWRPASPRVKASYHAHLHGPCLADSLGPWDSPDQPYSPGSPGSLGRLAGRSVESWREQRRTAAGQRANRQAPASRRRDMSRSRPPRPRRSVCMCSRRSSSLSPLFPALVPGFGPGFNPEGAPASALFRGSASAATLAAPLVYASLAHVATGADPWCPVMAHSRCHVMR